MRTAPVTVVVTPEAFTSVRFTISSAGDGQAVVVLPMRSTPVMFTVATPAVGDGEDIHHRGAGALHGEQATSPLPVMVAETVDGGQGRGHADGLRPCFEIGGRVPSLKAMMSGLAG